ncbi:unnamed protein product [Oikopleura dioica]|uniref:Uncharacterized protein n=1 Tax=Oikopleura dioica TaxID=34765 RepID=E4Y4A7_OIKDI|nr:unnamed protein product [Oikopleura dioica]
MRLNLALWSSLATVSSAIDCYQCRTRLDHLGNVLPLEQTDCMDDPNEDYQLECPLPSDKCGMSISYDWGLNGKQLITFQRECVPQNDLQYPQAYDFTVCRGNDNIIPHPPILYRSCLRKCDPISTSNSNHCNGREMYVDMLPDLQAGAEIENLSCHKCSYVALEDGFVNGNQNCYDSPEDVEKRPCEEYLSRACFNAHEWVYEFQQGEEYYYEEDHRGCSAFDLADSVADDFTQECESGTTETGAYSECKSTCKTNNCNTKTITRRNSCKTCTVSVDQFNNTISGDIKCWDDAEFGNSEECPADGDYICQTDMEVDWPWNGEPFYTLRRGCVKRENVREGCVLQGGIGGVAYQIKDCYLNCDPDQFGDDCNTGMGVSALFPESEDQKGYVQQSCLACDFESSSGSVVGNPNCPDNTFKVDGVACPLYASAGCFTASYTSLNDASGVLLRKSSRGCSTFQIDTGHPTDPRCDEIPNSFEGYCKNTCKDSRDCNSEDVTDPPLPITGSWSICQQCSETVNSENTTLGLGDVGCFADGRGFAETCPNKNDMCATELLADWDPKGRMIYTMDRKCTTQTFETTCFSGSSTYIQYKDCIALCNPATDGSGCNVDLDAVAAKYDVGTVSSCYTCENMIDDDGIGNGRAECGDKIDGSSSIPTRSCPKYANAACIHAAGRHEVTNGVAQDEHRSCSPFEYTNNDECYEFFSGGTSFTTCKNSCTINNCNTDELTLNNDNMCHVCTATMDHTGTLLGVSDPKCFDKLDDSSLQACPGTCQDEMIVDWAPNGNQIAQIRRSCGPANLDANNGNCLTGNTQFLKYKDCIKQCEGSACNNDLSVGDLYEGGKVSKCLTCSYVEADDGTVNGDTKCLNDEWNTSADCPNYMSNACFTGAANHNYNNQLKQETYKGCSAFVLEEDEKVTSVIDGTGYSLTKTTCPNNDCNDKHIVPDPIDGNTEPIDGCFCQTCTVTLDQEGNVMGTGNAACFEGDIQFLQTCPKDHFCKTDLEVDWLAKGQMTYRMIRGSTTLKEAQPCYTGSTQLIQYKDCSSVCDPSENAGCNNGIEEIEDKFSTGIVRQCRQCNYIQSDDGTVNGRPECGFSPSSVPSANCPKYADAACYSAASFHKSYAGNGEEIEEDFRGCSPFPLNDNRDECVTASVSGLDHTNCKHTCTSNNCNTKQLSTKHNCVVCSATIDAQGNLIGNSNPNCFDNADKLSLTECETDFNTCETEILVDWFARGDQQTTIRRKCVRAPTNTNQPCITGSSLTSGFRYKDCFTQCEEEGCNNDLESIGSLFDDEEDFADIDECVQCKYLENEDGTVSGNKNCWEPSLSLKGACPRYARSACYTGSYNHAYNGENLEEVYKGCSSFKLDEDNNPEYMTGALPGGDNFNAVKETCATANCNIDSIHAPPTNPDNSFKCFECMVTLDHLGNVYGQGDRACFDNPRNDMLVECESGQCRTEMLVDWYLKGEQLVRMDRRCAPKAPPPPQECTVGETSMMQWKDCMSYCAGQQCNDRDHSDYVMSLFDARNGENLECHSCTYAKDQFGAIVGGSREECQKPDVSNEGFIVDCPIYANAACFTAASWHTEGLNELEEDYKGCSTFSNRNTPCYDWEFGTDKYQTCKQTCETDGCNAYTPERSISCYQCTTTVDSSNKTIGIGDANCFNDNPGEKYLLPCPLDAQVCTVEIAVDWLITGEQYYKVKRGCAAEPVAEECVESVTGNGQYFFKDCFSDCSGNGCNDALTDAALKFQDDADPAHIQDSCYTCDFIEEDNGDTSGNSKCGDEPSLIGNADKACPLYANRACFTGTNAHFDSGDIYREQVHKGCSSFALNDKFLGQECGVINDPSDAQRLLGVCKETCKGENCNELHQRPCIPGYDEGCDVISCYQCDVTVDQFNNTIGTGDARCLSDNPEGLAIQVCDNEQPFCVSEIETDWYSNGVHQFRFKRGCSRSRAQEECFDFTGANGQTYFKDCQITSENSFGNAEMTPVAEKFEDDQDEHIHSCYACNYNEYEDGTVNGLPSCGETPVDTIECPHYACASCFTGTEAHYNAEGSIIESIYKGCSPFVVKEMFGNPTCYQLDDVDSEGRRYGTCKQTCSEENCNKGHERPCLEGEDCTYPEPTTSAPDTTTSSASGIFASIFAVFISFLLL